MRLTTLSKYDPFVDFMGFQKMVDTLLDDSFPLCGVRMGSRTWRPSVDIYEEPEAILIEADLPGLTKKDVTVKLEDNVLSIHGERKLEHEEKGEKFHRSERVYGAFSRTFPLPERVDPAKIEAEFKHGVLRVRLPKREEAKPRQIDVKVN